MDQLWAHSSSSSIEMTYIKVLDSQKHTTLLMTQALYNPTHYLIDYQNK